MTVAGAIFLAYLAGFATPYVWVWLSWEYGKARKRKGHE